MSDTWVCGSTKYYVRWFPSKSTPGKSYLVTLTPSEFVCTCWPFKKSGSCQHVQQAEREYCGWKQHTFEGTPTVENGMLCCPMCKGPVINVSDE